MTISNYSEIEREPDKTMPDIGGQHCVFINIVPGNRSLLYSACTFDASGK